MSVGLHRLDLRVSEAWLGHQQVKIIAQASNIASGPLGPSNKQGYAVHLTRVQAIRF